MPRIQIENTAINIIDNLSSQEAFDIVFTRNHEKIFNDKLIVGLGLVKRNISGLGLIPDASYHIGNTTELIEIGHNGLFQEPLHNVNKAFRDIEKWDHLNCEIFTIQIIEDVIKVSPTHIASSKYYFYNDWGKGINYYLNNRHEIKIQESIINREFDKIDPSKTYYKSKKYCHAGTEIQFHMIITGPHIGNSNTIKSRLSYLK